MTKKLLTAVPPLLIGLPTAYLIHTSPEVRHILTTSDNAPFVLRNLVQLLELAFLCFLAKRTLMPGGGSTRRFERQALLWLWALAGLWLCILLPLGFQMRPEVLHRTPDLMRFQSFLPWISHFQIFMLTAWLLIGLFTGVFYAYKKRFADVDEVLLPSVLFLIYQGFILLLRLGPDLAKVNRTGFYQILYFGLGVSVCGLILVPAVRERLLAVLNYPYLLLLAACGFLAVTFVFGTALSGGKALWIVIGGVSFQPVEISKILFVLVISVYLEKKSFQLQMTRGVSLLLSLALISGSFFMILYFQRDFGPILLLLLTCSWLFLTVSRQWAMLPVAAVIAALGVWVVLTFQAPTMVYNRIMDSWDPITFSGQLTKGLWAQGSGGIWGTGLGFSKAYAVPIVESDYIFSALLAEKGFLGGFCLLAALVLFCWRAFQLAQVITPANRRDAVFLSGLTMTLFVQAFLIIAGNLALLPLTGITLPFVSAGGTGLILNLAVVYLILALVARNTTVQQVTVFGRVEDLTS